MNISAVSSNKSIKYFMKNVKEINKNIQKSVIIMDEVDGLGAADKGGI